TPPLSPSTTLFRSLSVLKTTWPSHATAAVGPSSFVFRCHASSKTKDERVEVVAAKAAPDQHQAMCDRRRRHGAARLERHTPPLPGSERCFRHFHQPPHLAADKDWIRVT